MIEILGVTAQILRNWDRSVKLKSHHISPNGYCYCSEDDLNLKRRRVDYSVKYQESIIKTKKGVRYCKTKNVLKSEKQLLKINHRLTNICYSFLQVFSNGIVMRVFNESLFNKLSEDNCKDLSYIDNIESTDDFINNMKSFGVEFDETDIKVLESISEFDSVEKIKSKLGTIGLEVCCDDIKEAILKLKGNSKSRLLGDEELRNVNGGVGILGFFGINLTKIIFKAAVASEIGGERYGTHRVVRN